jgi:hypothetical protein
MACCGTNVYMMRHGIKAVGIVAVLGNSPAFADANKTFIEITATVHQMMTDVILADLYCPKIRGIVRR